MAGAGGCVVGRRKADANVKIEKDKTCKKRTVEGCLTFPCGRCPLATFQRSLSPPAGDRHVFPGQPHPLSTDRSEMLSVNCQRRWKEFLLKLLTEQSCCQIKIQLLRTPGL